MMGPQPINQRAGAEYSDDKAPELQAKHAQTHAESCLARPELVHFSGRRIAPVPNLVAEYGNRNGVGVGSVEFLE